MISKSEKIIFPLNLMEFKDKNVLFISGHTDDAEITVGATMARLVDEGANVYYLALTATDNKEMLREEATNAMAVLGISKSNYIFHDFQDMKFPEQRQPILQFIERYRDLWHPQIVFCPAFRVYDHQDHKTASWAAITATKWTVDMILGYDITWNTVVDPFNPKFYMEVSYDHLIKKMDALRCYKSQAEKFYASEKVMEARARATGVQVGVRFAESFEIYREVVRLGYEDQYPEV